LDNDEKFTTFLLQEYNNIAHAHFNLTNTITSFFKQYILIMTLPVTIITFIANYSAGSMDNFYQAQQFIMGFSIFLFIVGFTIMLYIVNLRFDSILYARTVNGIRRYFYEKAKLTPLQESKYRVLPTKKDKPSLTTNIYPMVIAFYFLNTGYPVFAMWWFYQKINLIIFSSFLSLLLHITFIFILHSNKEKFFNNSM